MLEQDINFDDDSNEQVEVRRQKLAKISATGQVAYPNDFKPTRTTAEIHAIFGNLGETELSACSEVIYLGGRIMGIRKFGKAAFCHVQDRSGRFQIYLRKDRLGEREYALLQSLDVGDPGGMAPPLRQKQRPLVRSAGNRLLHKRSL